MGTAQGLIQTYTSVSLMRGAKLIIVEIIGGGGGLGLALMNIRYLIVLFLATFYITLDRI